MPNATPTERSIRLVRPPDVSGVGVFRIADKKAAVYYVFRQIPCEIGGRGFVVHRLGLGDLYHVRIGADHECSCECLGFLAHGQCKHIEGLLTLARHGLI
jgi:hypothetical protein